MLGKNLFLGLLLLAKIIFFSSKFRFPPMPRAQVVPTNELGTFHIPTSPTIEKKTKKTPKNNIKQKATLKMVYYATMNRLMHIANLPLKLSNLNIVTRNNAKPS